MGSNFGGPGLWDGPDLLAGVPVSGFIPLVQPHCFLGRVTEVEHGSLVLGSEDDG